MRKNIFLICFLLLFLTCCFEDCPTTPEEPNLVKGNLEIMYVRVLSIINPNALDPTGDAAAIWHRDYGGRNSSKWVQIESEKWTAAVKNLMYSKGPYYIFLIDRKVERTYGEAIARRIFVRPEGTDQWIELTVIEKIGFPEAEGEWARFYWDQGVVKPQ